MLETEECKSCKYYDRFTDWDSLVTYPCSFAMCQYEPKEEKEYVVKTTFVDVKRYGYDYKKCGNCGEEYMKKDAYDFAYCPKCGAKFINVKK